MSVRPRLDLVATVDVAGTVTPSPAQVVPPGFDIAGGQCVFALAGYAGGTAQAVLQGSNDDTAPTNWSDVLDANTSARGANGVEMLGTQAVPPVQIVPVGQYKWVRLNLTIAGGPPVNGSVSCALVTPGLVGTGQAGV